MGEDDLRQANPSPFVDVAALVAETLRHTTGTEVHVYRGSGELADCPACGWNDGDAVSHSERAAQVHAAFAGISQQADAIREAMGR